MSKRGNSSANRRNGKKAKKLKNVRIPNKILDDAEAAGAVRERCPGEDLCILRMKFEDDAYNIVNDWVSTVDADPGVHAIFAPTANIVGTPLSPDNGIAIQNEANSIINHYAPFNTADFHGGPNPVIPGPIGAPVMPINVQHAKIVLHAVHQRIQTMNDANYPVLSNLSSGSYICNVLIQWANVAQTTALFRP